MCIRGQSERYTYTCCQERAQQKTTANWYLLVYRGVLFSPPTAIPSFSSQQNASTLIHNAMQKPSSKHVMMVGILQLLCFLLTLLKNTHTGNSQLQTLAMLHALFFFVSIFIFHGRSGHNRNMGKPHI